MTFDRLSQALSRGISRCVAFVSRVASRVAASRVAGRLRDLPTGWHLAIRGLSIALVLWVAGATAVDRVVAARSRSQEVVAAAPAGPAPTVAKLQDKKPFVAGPAPQVLPVTGTNFQPGMTARLISPMDADTTTFPPTALENLSSTSFELRAALETAGAWQLSVRTPDGQRSNSITITVRK
jgi:hypothetical protein